MRNTGMTDGAHLGRRPRILAIDDTPANLMVLASAISGEFTVQLANSGASGLSIAEAAPPDLILLDMMMPEMDGLETCRRFKQNPALAHIPIVFVTALDDSGSEIDGLRLGAVDYLHKPLQVEITRQRLRNLIERESLRREVVQQRDQLEDLVAQRTRALEQTNRELSAAKTEAEVASRVKSAILSNVSHELRTPLNAVLGLTHILKRSIVEPAHAGRLSLIEASARRMLSLVEDMLSVASMESSMAAVAPQTVSPREILQKVSEEFLIAARAKSLRLEISVHADVPQGFQVLAEPLRQILRRLLANAVKFSDQGEIRLTVEAVQSGLRFAVQDEGIGIGAAELPQLFEAFARADTSLARRHEGLGLGLALCRHLADLMGARLAVTSTLGVGSRFWLDLPLHLPEPQPALLIQSDPEPVAVARPVQPTDVKHGTAPDLAQRRELETLMTQAALGNFATRGLWLEARPWLLPVLGAEGAACEASIEGFAFEQAARMLQAFVQDHPEWRHRPAGT